MLQAATRWTLGAVFPSVPGLPGLDAIDCAPGLGRLRQAPWTMRIGLAAAVAAFWLSPALTIGRPLPAPLLGGEALQAHCQAMAASRWYPLRQAMLMLKTVGGLLWGADPTVRAAFGLPALPPDPGTRRGGDA